MATLATPATQEPARAQTVAAQAIAAYTRQRQQAVADFLQHHRIRTLWRALTQATDRLLQTVPTGPLTLIAIGGYGRRELFPYSDVDVLILVPNAAPTSVDQAAIDILQSLWDQRVPVSHATRDGDSTIALAKTDATVAAALMDARYVTGDRGQYRALKQALKHQVYGQKTRAFVAAKLAERDGRHARYGDSRFMLEPNIKEGKGGLRDLQTLTWLMRDAYGVRKAQQMVRQDLLSQGEWRHYQRAYLFFSTLRAHVHVLRQRADERLSFDMQATIATSLGFRGATPQLRAQRMMLRYFHYTRAVGNMTRILCALLEEQQYRTQPAMFLQHQVAQQLPAYLTIDHGRLNFSSHAALLHQPHEMIGLFAQAQIHGMDIHPRAQLALSRALPSVGRTLSRDAQSNQLFRSILLAPAPDATLRRMNEMGVLARIVPEFAPLIGQMQYDGYHTYTVDEHILVAIGHLHQFESGALVQQHPLATTLARETHHRTVLYVAMLCHDIGKGRGGAHADKGAHLATTVAQRLKLSDEECQLVGWLVKHHALLSDAAFKRDLDDPQTIADCVAIVQSPERLRLLLLITTADIKAVGPRVFNGWKGALLRTLYHRAMVQMGVRHHETPPPLPQTLIARYRAQPHLPALAIEHDAFRAVTIVTGCMHSTATLFATLAGAMAWIGASIVSARIRQLSDNEASGAALAELHIQTPHGESFADDEKRLRPLEDVIARALDGSLDIARELTKRRVVSRVRGVAVKPSVFIDNRISAQASVIEVNATDRVGLLYDILCAIEACQLHVVTAQLATYGQLAVDVFYVKDSYGHKITHPGKQQQLQQKVLAAVGVDAQNTAP